MTDTDIIPLDLNESYWLLDEDTIERIRGMPRSALSVYPSYDELIAAIAAYASVAPENVCVAPGSDEAIRATVRYCANKKYRALLVLPTFSGYERVLMETPLDTIRLYYAEQNSSFVFPLEATLELITQRKIDVVFLCEPNNPLGSILGEEALKELLDAAKDANVLIVTDEAYGEYGGSSASACISRQPLIVLRTLSKAFGVPGIRIGYTLASPDIVKQLREDLFRTLPWIIPGPSVYVACIVLSRAKELLARKGLVIKERDIFSAELASVPGMTVYPSFGNFVLTRHPKAAEIAKALLQQGIRIGEGERKTWDSVAKKIMNSTLRMSVPSPEHRPRVIEAIKAAQGVN